MFIVKSADKVLINTGILYAQLIIGLIINLFTTRIVINALGVSDYGIYMLVAGIVSMLGILNSNMANTSMRFMAHSIGTGVKLTISKTFNTTLFLHLIIGIFVVLFMEIGGWFMFEYFLDIPSEKLFDAKIVFHFMAITTFITVISVPYDAVINSHENLLALSLVDILGYILKLGIAIYLTYSNTDLLILYGFLMFLVQVTLRIIKQWYSKIKYDECKIRFGQYIDRKLLREIFLFSLWNLLNSISALSIVQIKGVFLNVFFGVGVNAADGVANQASSQINMVSVSMTRALNPQVMKNEGSGNREKVLYLTEVGTKYSVFLFALFAIPLIFEAPYLLNIWLKTVPEYAVVFFQIILVALLIEKFTFEITTAIRAVGIIKKFQIFETSILLLNIPIYYIVLKLGFPPYSIFISSIIVSLFGAIVRLYFGKKIAGIDIELFFNKAIFPVIVPIAFTVIFTFFTQCILPESIFRVIITLGVSMLTMILVFWNYGMGTNEKMKMKKIVFSIPNKLKKHI